jgi:hypothetical protein
MSLSSWLSWTFSRNHARRAKRRNTVTTSSQRRHTFQLVEPALGSVSQPSDNVVPAPAPSNPVLEARTAAAICTAQPPVEAT